MFVRSLLILFSTGLSGSLLAQSVTQNYVLSRTFQTRQTTDVSGNQFTGKPRDAATQVIYYDGLGKPIQQVNAFQGGQYQDIIINTEYDALNRPYRSYLPIGVLGNKGNLSTATSSYYNSASVCAPTTASYTQTAYEPTPLSRVASQTPPGSSGNVSQAYGINDQNNGDYQVKLYSITSATAVSTSGAYPAGTLTYTQTTDEIGNVTLEFRDRYERVVLKRVKKDAGTRFDTYYLYNDLKQLQFVLQPEFQTTADLALFAFSYQYDARGRMTSKKVPGAGTMSLYYNNQDLLTQTTDAKNQSLYYKYDNQNRQVGVCKGDCGPVDGNGFPQNGLSLMLYDNFSPNQSYPPMGGIYPPASRTGSFAGTDLPWTLTDDFVDVSQAEGGIGQASRTGLLTASWTRLLTSDVNLGSWLQTLYYYDNKGRLIQTYRQLAGLGTGAYERVSYKRDFAGRVVTEKTTQFANLVTYVVRKDLSYDQVGRLLTETLTVTENGATKKSSVPVLIQSYNEIGQLNQKQLNQQAQKLNYKYTPRGWLCSVQTGLGQPFSLGLTYQNNGNISSLDWGTKTYSGGMDLLYDGANRLTSATGKPTGSFAGYSESIGSYDGNGNIKALSRSFAGTSTNQLSYAYTGNQLTQVEDASANTDPAKGFVGTASHSANEMGYDANGNLNKDLNRGLADGGLSYNVLNLPAQVSTSTGVASYTYDGGGQKRQRVDPTGTTLYEGAFEYKADGTLLRIALEEGQMLRDPVTGVYTVQYYLRDHLGNVRQVLNEDQSVAQQTEYYAFGLSISRQMGANKYLYNGKEHQPVTGWLDYGARMYEPALGRWMVVDPLAEVSRRWSPFAYVYNNPMNFTDPDGMLAEGHYEGAAAQEAFRQEQQDQQGRNGPGKGKKAMISGNSISSANMPGVGFRKFDNGTYQKFRTSNGIGNDDADAITETALGFTPAGTYLDFYTLVTGKEFSTDNDVSWGWRLGGLFPLVSEIKKAGKIWTSTKRFSSVQNAYEHWSKHKADFPQFNNAAEYVQGTFQFLTSPPRGALSKIRANGEKVIYDPSANVFGVMTGSGVPKTMFKPDPTVHGYLTNLDYFNAQ
ncbi:RHS repeat-associated core domain-containing protein [Spirosoma sp. KNUC1025]|uniref:DUF6443 domain-containing protein n=1 Tax=Spirosoma sp. KNUC1025 TaxID=2894082 RepID=UPI00386FD904|nr:DUF6443 domain-containing protein [Spirosoma sp. KNUC1025]